MFSELLLAASFQIGPFYQQKPEEDYYAFRPFWSHQAETTDVLWPVFTAHRDWWRFCFFTHYQEYENDGYQFEIMPLWWNGRSANRGKDDPMESYWGLFPIFGHHPHFLLMHDIDFVLWPIWMRYRMPRPSSGSWMTSNSVLFPLIHWRDDGSGGLWPLYVRNYQRESLHQTLFWPIITWSSYHEDRDTAGEGFDCMLWPVAGLVCRERERQLLVLPPLFSHAETPAGWRGRYPWPIVDIERRVNRDRTSVFPLFEHVRWKGYRKGEDRGSVWRFGWKLVEIYDDETRVFPFWTSRRDDSYFRLWPFWESERVALRDGGEGDGWRRSRCLALFPMRWVDSVDRNWSKFWTFYEREESEIVTDHSLFWGIIRWRTVND